MFKFIVKYFWIFLILGMLAGIFIPASLYLSPYILYLLIFVLFLSCLKINLGEIFSKIKDFKLITYLVFLILIIVPVFFYLIINRFFEFEYGLAILVLLVMPAGMATPVYSDIFKGDKALALVVLVITSLLCPLTIPLLIYFLAGVKTNINVIQMFITLSMIIFIPFILSILFRKIAKKAVISTKKYYSAVSILIIMLIIAGAISKVDFINVINTDKSIIYPFLLLFVITILLYLIGYYSIYKRNNRTKITSALTVAYMNSTLAIVFAAEFFSPKTVLLVTLYQIPTTIAVIGFGYIVNKYNHKEIKA